MTTYEACVPGKIMLAGEYAVLSGGRALAVGLDRTLRVSLVKDDALAPGALVRSDLWDEVYSVSREDPPTAHAAVPLLDTVRFGLERFNLDGLLIDVRSDLTVSHGIGSSSALRLATLLAMADAAGQCHEAATAEHFWPVAKDAFLLQRQAQKAASGYDTATQLLGGIVSMQRQTDDEPWPGSLIRRATEADLAWLTEIVHPFVGGRGAPTAAVMGETRLWLDTKPQGHLELMELSEGLVEAFLESLNDPADESRLMTLIAKVAGHRRFFEQAPHALRSLYQALASLPHFDQGFSVKTTGAGGEDALVLIGRSAAIAPARAVLADAGWKPLPAGFASAGASLSRKGQRL